MYLYIGVPKLSVNLRAAKGLDGFLRQNTASFLRGFCQLKEHLLPYPSDRFIPGA